MQSEKDFSQMSNLWKCFILIDDKTGQQYMSSVQELESGIIQYVPELHAHLWNYILVNGQLYSIHPDLIDWDQEVEEWKEDIMGQWPFGIQLTADQRLLKEALNCLDLLDSYLQFEEWEMDQIKAQEENDNDDDDDNDVDIVSEDEGYDSEDDDENDIDQWNFGIASVLWYIQL